MLVLESAAATGYGKSSVRISIDDGVDWSTAWKSPGNLLLDANSLIFVRRAQRRSWSTEPENILPPTVFKQSASYIYNFYIKKLLI